jgi:hypothetical protein
MTGNDQVESFGRLAKAYVRHLAIRERLRVSISGQRFIELAKAVKRVPDPASRGEVEIALTLFMAEIRLTVGLHKVGRKAADHPPQTSDVIAEVGPLDASGLHVTFWKQDSQGHKDPLSRLTDPAPGRLRRWLLQGRSADAESQTNRPGPDPLLALSGVFESELTDISERHDDYLGQALASGSEGEPDG